MVKFINNFLAQFTPFVFYLGGGILAIRGNLDIGQLVAVIAAYKDLPGPIKELIDWDYQRLDVQVKYLQVVNAFDVTPLAPPPDAGAAGGRACRASRVRSAFRQVSATDESGKTLLNGLDLTIELHEDVVAIGATGEGAEVVGELIARLIQPSAGTLNVGSTALSSLPEWQTGRRIGYVGPEPFFAHGTARDALLSGLRHAPFRPAPEGSAMTPLILREAQASGNPPFDRHADWIDYEAAGASTEEELANRITEVLALVSLEEDFYAFGLRTKLSDATDGEGEEMFLNARRMFLDRLTKSDNAADVEPFVVTQFNSQLTLFQNLVFGAVSSPELLPNEFPANSPLWKLPGLGWTRQAALPARAGSLRRHRRSVRRSLRQYEDPGAAGPDRPDRSWPTTAPRSGGPRASTSRTVSSADRQKFIRVALSYSEPRHRLDLLTDELREAVVRRA